MEHDAIEDRLQVRASRAHRVEHVGHCRLSFERGVEVVEQTGVDDGDGRLVSERLKNWRQGAIEGTGLVAHEREVADPHAVENEGDVHQDCDPGVQVQLEMTGLVCVDRLHLRDKAWNVVEVLRLAPIEGSAVQGHVQRVGRTLDADVAVRRSRHPSGSVDDDLVVDHVAPHQRHAAPVGVAQLGCPGDDAVEDEVQVAGMRAYQSQNVARRRLQSECVGQLAPLLRSGRRVPGLDGEGAQELDFVVRERLDCAPRDVDPERRPVTRQREVDGGLRAGEDRRLAGLGIVIAEGRLIVESQHLPLTEDLGQRGDITVRA